MVNEVGHQSEGLVMCGGAGNPNIFGTDVDKVFHNSCLIIAYENPADASPQWFVYFHEIGHNFTACFDRFRDFALEHDAYLEGLASLAGFYAFEKILNNASTYGLSNKIVTSLQQDYGRDTRFLSALDAYVAAGADYQTMDADIVDGILIKLEEDYGLSFWYRFFSVFLPAYETLEVDLTTDAEVATYFVAACSAAARTDLRTRFRDVWGFPINDGFYNQIYPAVQIAVAQRDPRARINYTGEVQIGNMITLDGSSSYDPQGLPLTYAWSLTKKPVTSSAFLSDPSSVSPTLPFDKAGDYTVTLMVDNGLTTSEEMTQDFTVLPIHAVSMPNNPSGPSNGTINTSYSFNTGDSTDSHGHSVEYRFYWGNGLYSSWSSSTSASKAWSNPGIYQVQAQARCASNHSIVSSWSSKKAVTISKPWSTKRLTNSTANLKYPKIASSGSCLYVAFLDGNTLAFKRSTDGGATWGARQNLSTSGTLQNNPYTFAIAPDGQYVHVVIAKQSSSNWKIYYRRNTNYGASGSWGSWRELTSGSGDFLYPDIAVDGQYVHIVFQASWPGNWEIFYKRISNYGVGSSFTRRLTYSSTGASQCPRIATSSEYVYVLYQDDWPANVQLFFKRIANYGAGSILTKRITHCGLNSNHHDIAAYDQYVFVLFRNINPSTGNTDIFSKTMESYATGSITTKRLTYAACCDWPSVSFDSSTNEVEVAYHNDSPGNYEIFWKPISNHGKGSYSTHRLTYSASGTSQYPDILVLEGITHIVYQDDWPGSIEIFYKYR